MKTDSLCYYLFQTAPVLFFDLLGQSNLSITAYQFRSIELKQTAFRIDGILFPPEREVNQPLFFVEVQFQNDPYLYHRLFAEVFLYLEQNPQTTTWQAVVIYPRRSLEPENTEAFRSLLSSPQVQRIYLNELEPSNWGVSLMQLMIQPPEQALQQAVQLLEQPATQLPKGLSRDTLSELIETIMVYKFPRLSRQEIAKMLGISELRQTRVFQEGLEEGRQEGRQEEVCSLVLRLLTRRFGTLPDIPSRAITQLSLVEAENLAEALLEFSTLSDLQTWLEEHS